MFTQSHRLLSAWAADPALTQASAVNVVSAMVPGFRTDGRMAVPFFGVLVAVHPPDAALSPPNA